MQRINESIRLGIRISPSTVPFPTKNIVSNFEPFPCKTVFTPRFYAILAQSRSVNAFSQILQLSHFFLAFCGSCRSTDASYGI